MNELSIYFGSQVISIVESKGKNLVNSADIPYSLLAGNALDEKVPEDIKLVTLLKNELNKNKIEAKEVTICLSGKDLVIRHFEMPIMPSSELITAINFEAKKYIPFKIEELAFDFQWKFDKRIQKNHALFAAIKKEALDRYQSALRQAGFKIVSVEYAAFSALRLLGLNNVAEKGNIAVVNVDLNEDDEMNFMALENGFPLFSRDITFAGIGSDISEVKENRQGAALDKLKREMRISLDYYNRKFPLKNIKKIFFISAEGYNADLEAFAKEVGSSAQFLDLSHYLITKPANFSLSFLKAYGGSLSKAVKSQVKIDLLVSKAEAGVVKDVGILLGNGFSFFGLKFDFRVLALGILICVLVFFSGIYRTLPLKRKLKNIIDSRTRVSALNNNVDYETMNNMDVAYKQKISTMDNLLKNQIYVTYLLDSIPRIIPEGMWITGISFKRGDDSGELILVGMSYLGDNAKEFEAVNNFLAGLKKNQVFSRYFKEISLVSLNQQTRIRTCLFWIAQWVQE